MRRLKLPRLKELRKVGNITVYEVDGAYIRQRIDPDFTDYSHHKDSPYIPENEWWIDRENAPSELKYFLIHLKKETAELNKGTPHHKAHQMALTVERRARLKGKRYGESVYLKLLRVVDDVKVYLVDGSAVRAKYDPDFTEGANDRAKKYIPEGEVWIDDDLVPTERSPVIGHEIYERERMIKGDTYTKAHKKANKVEKGIRKRVKSLKSLVMGAIRG